MVLTSKIKILSSVEIKTFQWKPDFLNGFWFRTSCITLWIDHNESKYSRKTLVTRYSTKGTAHKWCHQFFMTFWPLSFPILSLFEILKCSRYFCEIAKNEYMHYKDFFFLSHMSSPGWKVYLQNFANSHFFFSAWDKSCDLYHNMWVFKYRKPITH